MHIRKGREGEEGDEGGPWKSFKGGGGECPLRGMDQHSQLRMLAAVWVGIPVEITQEASVVPRCRRAAIGTSF